MVLGTDGYGRSDTREKLREFFEINEEHIVYNALLLLKMSDDAKNFKKKRNLNIRKLHHGKLENIEIKIPNLEKPTKLRS